MFGSILASLTLVSAPSCHPRRAQAADRSAALRQAINTHSKTTLNAMMGKGYVRARFVPCVRVAGASHTYCRVDMRSVDRHLFALRKLFEAENPGAPLPAIFADQGLATATKRGCGPRALLTRLCWAGCVAWAHSVRDHEPQHAVHVYARIAGDRGRRLWAGE